MRSHETSAKVAAVHTVRRREMLTFTHTVNSISLAISQFQRRKLRLHVSIRQGLS